jgi:hypothetical protein
MSSVQELIVLKSQRHRFGRPSKRSEVTSPQHRAATAIGPSFQLTRASRSRTASGRDLPGSSRCAMMPLSPTFFRGPSSSRIGTDSLWTRATHTICWYKVVPNRHSLASRSLTLRSCSKYPVPSQRFAGYDESRAAVANTLIENHRANRHFSFSFSSRSAGLFADDSTQSRTFPMLTECFTPGLRASTSS